MGGFFSLVWKLFSNKEVKVVILGLSNAGKSTILYKLHLGGVVETSPTVGVNTEKIKYKGLSLRMFDVGGQTSLRRSWECYYEDTDVIIFVVDSSDQTTFETSKQELFKLLSHGDLKNAKILVFANKQDKEDASSSEEITKLLNLTKIKSHDWHIEPCCALTGSGLTKGMQWIVNKIKS